MEENQEKLLDPLQETYFDIVEFAQNYFNSHERTPEGNFYI